MSSPFVVPGSERVYVDSLRLDSGDYEINYQLGVIRLEAVLPPSALVVVHYQRRPFFLKPVYSLRELEISPPREEDTVTAAIPSRQRKTSEPGRNLVFGGTKSVSFTIGSNRGTSLDQTLQATIEGQLTPTIKVKALLSDNNLPIQPEGNTEELEYLDQVFVQIEGTNARATLGDFGFKNEISTFSPFTRQLKGISAEAWTAKGKVILSGAESKGTFKTFQFRGRTGLQGPYEILSAGRNTGEVVIAGTERVYVDGELLSRGQNRDYVIDYDRGTITFTPRRLITTDSEIAVDFEVSQERYDRSTLFSAVETDGVPGGVTFQVLAAREIDDKNSPKNDTFTQSEIDVLESAGDDPARALTSGVSLTGTGQGLYVLVPADSVSDERFVYDDSTGNYNVSFEEVGEGSGDYVLAGISNRGKAYYEFRGAGQGNYRVGKALPLPESLSLVTARLKRDKGKHLKFDFEWNVSDYDRNEFSHVDDEDNLGDAGRFRIGVDSLSVGIGKIGVSGVFTTIEDRFKSFDKARPPYFYRDWNLENDTLRGRETLRELETGFARNQLVQLGYSLGRIERNTVTGTKHEGNFRLGGTRDRTFTGRGFRTNTERGSEQRTRRHVTLSGAYGLWRVAPSLVYSRERYRQDAVAEPDSGLAYELVRVRLANRKSRKFTASVELENRNTEEITSNFTEWKDTRKDQTIQGALGVKGNAVHGELLLTHRVSDDFTGPSTGTTTTDLARVTGFFRSQRLGLRTDVDYEISQNQSRALERSVIFTGKGKGDYNAQGEPVGKGKGDYTLVFLPTTSTVPTHRVSLTFRLAWKGARNDSSKEDGGWTSWIRSNVSLDQTVSVNEETAFDPAWKVYLMVPSALQRDESTLFGVSSIRQDWSFLDGYKNLSLTLRYQREDEEENRFEGVREERFFGQHVLRLSRSLSSLLTGTAELSREIRQRGGRGIDESGGSSYDVTAWGVLGGMGLRFSAGSSVDIDLKLVSQEDNLSGAAQTLLTFRPRSVWRLSRMISVFGSYDLTRTWDRTETTAKPLFFSSEGNAHRWNVAPNVRVSKYITIVAAYQGRNETTFVGDRVTEHELRLETRAYF